MEPYKEKKFELVAKTLFGLEEVLATELKQIGAEQITLHNRAVSFYGTNETMYRANLQLRTALRILKPIYKFTANNEDALYKAIIKYSWEAYLDANKTFAIDSSVSSQYFNHSKYIALKAKDAIADRFRNMTGKRPSVELDNPDLRINLHIYEDNCTVSLDSSGESLHRRGYRREMVMAPLNEALAAGMILLSGWNADCNLIDPMCGSGTILIEAAMIARNIPPGILRNEFGFQRWSDFDKTLWGKVRGAALFGKRDFKFQIIGSDISEGAFRIATDNSRRANLDDLRIKLSVNAFEAYNPPPEKGIVFINPPYDERMKEDDISAFYKMIGDTMKKKYAGYDVWILSSNAEALKHIGLRPSRKIALFNGSLECRLQKFSIYEGSKKAKFQQKERS